MALRRWLLAWVLFALVCAQALGFMHRVVHAPLGASAGAAQAAQADGASPAAHSWVAALFGGHDDPGCRLLDAGGQCGVPTVHLAAVHLPPAGGFLATPETRFVARPTAAFQARGPPPSP